MENLSDDDYDHVSDVDMCGSDTERGPNSQESTPSSPPSIQDLRLSDRKTQACPYEGCPKTFNRKARLAEHIRSHQNVRLFKCPHTSCDKDFLRQSHLNHHVKSAHTNVRDYDCTWEGCDKSFATGTRLRRHIQAHEGREKYRCRGYDGCNETFRKHETLKRHILSVHEQIKPFPCLQTDLATSQPCAKAFETAEKLARHQRNQHDAARFSCVDCVTNLSVAKNAVAVGDSINLPVAPGPIFFATYTDLQAHIADVHPPTCQMCPTSFKSLKELTRHLELQHGQVDPNTPKEEAIRCLYPDCGRIFTKKGNLTVHMKTVHEKRKDFVCGETELPAPDEFHDQPDVEVFGCGRRFGSKASLQDHVRTAHLGLPSKVVQGRRKRKAEQYELDEDFEDHKKRAPRKDKGVLKGSMFEALTGFPGAVTKERAQLGNNLTDSIHAYQNQVGDDDYGSGDDFDGEDDNDDWNQLSGSMTLVGDRMYHNGREYEYVSDQHNSDSTNGYAQRPRSQNDDHTYSYVTTNADDEPIFDNFEHEPELLHGNIDPAILRS